MNSLISIRQKTAQAWPVKSLFISLAAAVFLIAACAPAPAELKTADEKKPSAPGPELVGRVATVPADKRFVLIQSYGPWKVETGSVLTTRGPDERAANLRATGETLGEFAAADLQSGSIQVGDAVYRQPVIKPSETATTAEAPPNQGTASPGNLQKNN